MLLFQVVVQDPVLSCRCEDGRPIYLARTQRYTSLLPNGAGVEGPLLAFADVFYVHQWKAAGIAIEQLYRIVIPKHDPKNIHFKISEFAIHPFGECVEQCSIRTGNELVAVDVIAET